MRSRVAILVLAVLLLAVAAEAMRKAPFREYPIGENIEKNHLDIAAVWLPPVKMDHVHDLEDLKKKKKGESIHIEADIHALSGNKNGFGMGEWIPGLRVSYKLKNKASGKIVEGKLYPMVAKDGPHYGAQIFLPYGNYDLTFRINPPDSKDFGRHTDPVTGVDPWWKAFDVHWDFAFKGAKK